MLQVCFPLMPEGLDAEVPRPAIHPTNPRAIVVPLDAQHRIKTNLEPAALSALGPRLEAIFKTRNERVMFVKGNPDGDFADVAAMIDIAKGAGIENIGLMITAVGNGS